MNSQSLYPSFKNTATALIFSVLLGPVGLLYSSFWGGFMMIFVFILVFSTQQPFPIVLTWLICCIWSVGAVETYNKKLLKQRLADKAQGA